MFLTNLKLSGTTSYKMQIKWLVKLLISDSEMLIDKTQREVKEVKSSDYDAKLEEKRGELYKKHSKYQQQLQERLQTKWKKFKNSNSTQNFCTIVRNIICNSDGNRFAKGKKKQLNSLGKIPLNQ